METQLQETPETPTKSRQLLNLPPTDDSFHVAFLEVYRENRQCFSCPVSVCDAEDSVHLFPKLYDHSCCTGCSCDDLCEKRGDCCPERIENLFEPGRYPFGGMMDCRQTSLKFSPNFAEFMSGQFISRCDVTLTDDFTITNCQNALGKKKKHIENVIPVSDKNIEDAYKNVHYAVCNYVTEDNILYWDVKIACTESSLIPYS